MFNQKNIEEFLKCKDDPVYFINNYLIFTSFASPQKLYDYQETTINQYHKNQHSIFLAPRQCGKSFMNIAYILHYILFNEEKTAVLFATKELTARDFLVRLETYYTNLPNWMSVGVIKFNNHSLELENGSRVIVTSKLTQMSIDLLVLDEFAFVKEEDAVKNVDALFPVIFSRNTSKLIISSSASRRTKLVSVVTDEGYTEMKEVPTVFYQLWDDANKGLNLLHPIRIFWKEHPKWNDEWKEYVIGHIGESAWKNEYECEFLP